MCLEAKNGLLSAGSLDNDGFLTSLNGWDQALVHKLAELNNIGPLTDEHWQIINFVHDYYLKHGEGPPVVKIARATRLSLATICSLFPCGIARGAYRLAGLPRPAGCL